MARGDSHTISGYDKDLAAAHQQRLVELGFRPGARVTCTMAPRLGAPKLYRVATAVYSLERDIAERVLTAEEAA